MISIDDMHSENIWFLWSKSSNYQDKLRYHACDGRTDGKWKIGQCFGKPKTAKSLYFCALTKKLPPPATPNTQTRKCILGGIEADIEIVV